MSGHEELTTEQLAVEKHRSDYLSASDNQSTLLDSDAEDVQMTIGWREWICLPQLGLPAIKAKIDTGARTSAIHAFDIERVQRNNGQDWLKFKVYPVQRVKKIVRHCEAPLVDIRRVTDSGGHSAERFFIATELQLGPVRRVIEVTLSQRDDMLFRMLLGRTAMVPGIQVNPSQSFALGRLAARPLYAGNNAGPAAGAAGAAS